MNYTYDSQYAVHFTCYIGRCLPTTTVTLLQERHACNKTYVRGSLGGYTFPEVHV